MGAAVQMTIKPTYDNDVLTQCNNHLFALSKCARDKSTHTQKNCASIMDRYMSCLLSTESTGSKHRVIFKSDDTVQVHSEPN